MIGGGNYIEYQNLQDYAKTRSTKRIVYGCTELVNASQFLEQVNQCFYVIMNYFFFRLNFSWQNWVNNRISVINKLF